MTTELITRREQLVEDTFPYLNALWQSALGLSLNEEHAELLVLNTMKQACREWHLPSGPVTNKARLFRIFAGEFLGNWKQETPKPQPEQFLTEFAETTSYNDMSPQYLNSTMASRRRLLEAEASGDSVKNALTRLRPLSRLMIVLLLRERFSYAEIAYITDLRVASVRSIFYRLHRLIPTLLGENNYLSTTDKERWENEGGRLLPEWDGQRVCAN